jgi:hypothetical protein
VFEAFKEVEVAVRQTARLTDRDIGVDLVRKAFEKRTGPLREINGTDSERDAMAHLFSGAIGMFKNPRSDRWATLTDPDEATEMVMFANDPLRIVDNAAGTGSGDRSASARPNVNTTREIS